jgi:hypothetical protein
MIKGDAPAPDLTGKQYVGVEPSSDCATKWVLVAKLCNRGSSKAPAGIPGTFYLGDPRQGAGAICTAATSAPLSPGQCEVLKCDYKNPPQQAIDLWFRADDDGTGHGKELECKEKNNLLHVPKAKCHRIG